MSISTPFIHRPVATTLLLVAATMAGAIGYTLLPVAALPEVDFPTIMVSAGLPGASPDVMAEAVATPLEKQFTRIAGVTEMTSRSSVGSASITLQFDLNRDINGAAREVQAAINSAAGFLPSNLPSLPRYRKINPADQPIVLMTLESDVVPRPQLYDIASSVFAQKLAQVNGVGQVSVGGSSLPAVRVEVNPQPLARYNVGLDQIGTFLQGANANKPKGALANSDVQIPIYATDQLFLAKDYRDLVVVYRNGAPVRLSDLGRVIDANEDVRNLGLVNGDPMVQIQINRQPNANIIDTVARIKALMPQFQAQLPPTVHFKIASDRTTTTRESLRDAQRNVIVSICLVVLVVFVFLRSAWSTFIPSISVPVSIIATFGAMYLIGYTLDNLSLMALTIATGFVVDDAIVVIENITRHLEHGMKPMAAALKGAEEIGFTVLSMSMSLIAVFIPILMMSGVVGRLFREFAVILAVAIAISMVVSLTVVPMMCAWLLKEHTSHGYLYNQTEKIYQWVISSYGSALNVVLNRPATMLLTVLLTMGISVYLYDKIPKGFFPQQDTGRLQGSVMGEQHISYQSLVTKARWFEEKVRMDPDVETVTMVAGASGGGYGGANSAQINVQLKPVGVRKSTSDQVIARLRRQTSGVPGATMFLQNSQDVRVGGRQGNAQYQYTLQGPDFDSLAVWGPKLLDRLSTLPEIADVSSDQQSSGLSSNVVIDRDTASRLGLTAQAVDSALYDAFGQRQVSVMYKSINQYQVVLALQQQWWESPDFLNTIIRADAQGDRRSFVDLHALHAGDHAHFAATPGAVPGNHAFIQPDGKRLAERRRGRHQPGASGDGAAGQHHGQVRGHRAGLSGSACQPAHSDLNGAAGGLYRAGDSVREPDPPADDHFDAAVGGRGSADGHGPVQKRSGHRRHDRDYPADRHREEERDHDDRFRAGGRTQRGDEFAGCHLPGVSAEVPAHHDDDHVRAAGRAADGAGLGRGSGTAEASRNCDRRRPAGQPDADFVHHARGLSLFRPAAQAFRAATA